MNITKITQICMTLLMVALSGLSVGKLSDHWHWVIMPYGLFLAYLILTRKREQLHCHLIWALIFVTTSLLFYRAYAYEKKRADMLEQQVFKK